MKVRVPGDKSLTQRALILASVAEGRSSLRGLLHGGDAASTAAALRQLGVAIPAIPNDGSEIRIEGVGLEGLISPANDLDLGNSGTGARLLLGVLAGSNLSATLTGDASLQSRPMARVTDPLHAMGARFEHRGQPGHLPVAVRGRHPLEPLEWSSPVASAQVKSAILLAGLMGHASAMVTEPSMSRDHTERLLNHLGAAVVSRAAVGGWRVELRDPPERIRPLDFDVPGDISSAAFLLAFAALGGVGEALTVEAVGLNPARTAFLDVLERMGAPLVVEYSGDGLVEPTGDVTVRPASLRGVRVTGLEVPRLIDELPLIAVLGACADGTTQITGAAELRTKESDRIAAVVENLGALGASVEELSDGLVVEGTDRRLEGVIRSRGDHRIAMAFGVLTARQGNDIEIDDPDVADVSFPSFWSVLERLRCRDVGA
jgi:3-phosphoshikimate 1-carboxyvinyltransferase